MTIKIMAMKIFLNISMNLKQIIDLKILYKPYKTYYLYQVKKGEYYDKRRVDCTT